MTSIKSSAAKAIKRMQAPLEDHIADIQASVDQIRASQLEINHNQMFILNELQQRAKNSGTIMLSDTEMLVKIFSGLKMYLDPRDIAVVPHLALDAIWEADVTEAWLSVIGASGTVLDIGANFGYFGILAAQKMDRHNSKVVLFEPNKNIIPYLKKTLSVNWLNEQSVIANAAVGDTDGELTLHVLKDYLGSSSVHSVEHLKEYLSDRMYLEEADAQTVQSVSIDSYCQANGISSVDLIKMDIEGYEDTAYAGMRETVRASERITLFIEFTASSYKDPRRFYDMMLADFGNVYSIVNGALVVPEDTSYEAVISMERDWTMPVFSKLSLGELIKK